MLALTHQSRPVLSRGTVVLLASVAVAIGVVPTLLVAPASTEEPLTPPAAASPPVAAPADAFIGGPSSFELLPKDQGSGAGPAMTEVDGLFESSRGIPAIYIMDRDGANAQMLVRVPNARWNGSPAWSHDGTKIAFDATPAGWEVSRMYIASLTGPDRTKLLELGLGNSPRWSPDDKRITFYVRKGRPDNLRAGVWTMRADGRDRQWLAEGERPQWSPDGSKIACVNFDPKTPGIDVVDVASGKATRLVDMVYNEIPGPAWSPDGKSLAFCGIYALSPQRGELVIVDVEHPETRRVRFKGNVGWIPSWSPDGKSILFWIADDQSSLTKFHVIDAEGDAPPVMLEGQKGVRQNSDPDWSPDGKKIAFSNDR